MNAVDKRINRRSLRNLIHNLQTTSMRCLTPVVLSIISTSMHSINVQSVANTNAGLHLLLLYLALPTLALPTLDLPILLRLPDLLSSVS